MNHLDEIYQTYLVLNGWLLSQESEARPVPAVPWLRMAELNDYSFFVLLFGQLEDYINQEYEQYVGSWGNAAFEHRVNTVFAQASAEADLVKNYYDLRCPIAHGHVESALLGGANVLAKVFENIHRIIAQ